MLRKRFFENCCKTIVFVHKVTNTLKSKTVFGGARRGEEWPWERDYNPVIVIKQSKRLMLDQMRLKDLLGFNTTTQR